MAMRDILRWMTAADERERLCQVRESIANREAANRSPKQHVLAERDRLRRTIWLRLGTELVLLGTMIAATAAKLSGVLDGTPAQQGQTGRLEDAGAGAMRHIDFDAPGMMKTFVIVNLPEDQKAVDALHGKIGEALKLALQDTEMAEVYRSEDITILVTPNVSLTAQASVERLGVAAKKGAGVDFRTWSGDAITLSTVRKGRAAPVLQHTMILDEALLKDLLKMAVAFDHELGHVRSRRGNTVLTDIAAEEVDVFTGSIARLRLLAQRLRASNGPADPLATRLEQEVLPKEELLLSGWRSQRK